MSGRVRAIIEGTRNNGGAGFGGALTVQHTKEIRYGTGNGAGQIDRIFQGEPADLVVPVGAPLDLDLQALATAPDATLAATAIVGLFIEAAESNNVAVSVKPGASDPWLGWFTLATSEFALAPGDFVMVGGSDFPVSPTDKTLTIQHNGLSPQAIRVVILART